MKAELEWRPNSLRAHLVALWRDRGPTVTCYHVAKIGLAFLGLQDYTLIVHRKHLVWDEEKAEHAARDGGFDIGKVRPTPGQPGRRDYLLASPR